jgi:DNA-binding CsgD family transcriptional regulator
VGHLSRARWDEAAADAEEVLLRTGPDVNRMSPLLVLGAVRARRGDPEVWEPLDEVAAIARRSTDSPSRYVPVEVTRSEAALLAGDAGRAIEECGTHPVADDPDRWMAGRLAIARRRAGAPAEDTGPLPQPFALELAGRPEDAAEAWAELDCPYESAFARAFSDDVEELRRAHESLLELGARPAAALAARRLRERGVRSIPRGPRRATSEHPAGLTRRELDVLALVGDGLRNADIAERLVISEKTVDHHVSAILRKLGARTRTEAVRLAATAR